MKRYLLLSFLAIAYSGIFAQSKTTEALHKANEDALSFFFYNNTLRMLNQAEDPSFDALIKDIQKMKLLIIDKKGSFAPADYKELTKGYKSDKFEEIMTSRYQGKNFDVFLKDKAGKTEGMIVLVNDSSSLYVLDIVGSIALDQVTNLYKTLDTSSDISSKIKSFTNRNDSKKKDDDDDK